MIGLLLFLIAFVLPFPLPLSSWAASSYEESLKQLAEGVTERAAKAKKQRLAVLDFTDAQGASTPVGQFLAESLLLALGALAFGLALTAGRQLAAENPGIVIADVYAQRALSTGFLYGTRTVSGTLKPSRIRAQ